MRDFLSIYKKVYTDNELFGAEAPMKIDPFKPQDLRPNSIAVVGGALGDEGKGRVTDELTADFLHDHQRVVHYRDNGGANAGHTVVVDGINIALHQLSSGVLQKGCVVVLGKEMVLHPEDLVEEIGEVLSALGTKKLPSSLMIDEMAFLCLDTHRAFEAVLKDFSTGSKGATGRGIAPAYADITFRHPLRMRDLMAADWKTRIAEHYRLYDSWIRGFGLTLAEITVPRLSGATLAVGSSEEMTARLAEAREDLKTFIAPVSDFLAKEWEASTPFVFEKAQALGLDKRWGVYPDVTASDCSFDGIFSSTEGIVDPQMIAVRSATIKATYSSSVGSRKLPTLMTTPLADTIREDAHEYGATTKRPRDIAHIDLPMLSFLFAAGRVEYMVMTHLDIAYQDESIKVCVGYLIDGKRVGYRPDQLYLDRVTPEYIELPSWDGAAVQKAKNIGDLPKAALQYMAFISKSLNASILMATTGPSREQTIRWY
jgi:adenylosuccinate synthase